MLEPLITTITTSATPSSKESVYSLLVAVTPAISSLRQKCCYLGLQADLAGGSTKFAAGNSNVAPTTGTAGTGIGVQFAAGQTYPVGPFESNLINLKDVYVSASAASSIFNVTVVCR